MSLPSAHDEHTPAPRSQIAARPMPFPLPLAVLKPLFNRIVIHVAEHHPELFSRLGDHATKRFVIDPENLPFVLLLEPDPARPRLTVHRRGREPEHDASISGGFMTLFDMVDGRLDGDALFFTRELRVGGDTEAVVALRNALDDMDEDIAESISSAFGPFSPPFTFTLSLLRAFRRIRGHGS